jgi:hypothetical protein
MQVDSAVIAAVIGAVAAFVGGYFAGRWQARNTLAQWRRERLLQFCADLVAVGGELADLGRTAPDRYPIEIAQRFRNAVACVLLLGGEDLSDAAFDYQEAVTAASGGRLAATEDRSKRDEAYTAAAASQANFMWLAHNLLVDTPLNRYPWWQVWKGGPKPVVLPKP